MTQSERPLSVWTFDGFWARLRGLIGRPPPPPEHAVWITPCRQVHTLGMGYAIDVLHLDADGVILQRQTLAPWRLGRWVAGAAGVLELAAGEATRLGLAPGRRLRLIPAGTACYPGVSTAARGGGGEPMDREEVDS